MQTQTLMLLPWPPPPHAFPHTSKVRTEVIVQSFADRHVVVVTQLRKLGTIMTAEAVDGLEGRRSYEIHTLLGRRDDALLDVYARQLIEKIALTSAKPLLLTIALTEDGRGVDVFNDVLNTVLQIATW